MTDQQPTSQPPTARANAPVPILRRHWDGNGWTGVAAPAGTGTPPAAGADPELGRTAS